MLYILSRSAASSDICSTFIYEESNKSLTFHNGGIRLPVIIIQKIFDGSTFKIFDRFCFFINGNVIYYKRIRIIKFNYFYYLNGILVAVPEPEGVGFTPTKG